MGAGAAGFARAAAGLAAGLAAGFFLDEAGFLTCFGGGAAGVSSTTTGFGRNCVGSPATVIGSMFSDSG